MLPIEIRRVRSAQDRARFVKMAWQCYRNDPHWVPPLIGDQCSFIDPDRGVFFEHGEAELFLAYRGVDPVGRISAHVNRLYDEHFDDSKGFVGFFECGNDPEAAQALFTSAEAWLRSRGRRIAEGPLSFGIYDEIGILIDGFDTDPYLFTSHNPPYYGPLFEGGGWQKSVDWHAFRGKAEVFSTDLDPRYFAIAQRVLKRDGMSVRPVDMKNHLEREAGIVQTIFAEAWNKNWGHVPLSDKEFARLKDGVRQFVVPELSCVAELNGTPIAFALSLYDANVAVKKVNGHLFPFGFLTILAQAKKTRRFRLVLMGVLEAHRRQGIEVALVAHVIEEGLRRGFKECEMSQVVETNAPMISSLDHLPVERYRTWRIYRKDLVE